MFVSRKVSYALRTVLQALKWVGQVQERSAGGPDCPPSYTNTHQESCCHVSACPCSQNHFESNL